MQTFNEFSQFVCHSERIQTVFFEVFRFFQNDKITVEFKVMTGELNIQIIIISRKIDDLMNRVNEHIIEVIQCIN